VVTIEIGESRLPQAQVTAGWIAEQLQRRRDDGRSVCVRVAIESPEVSLTLMTPQCISRGGSVRALNQRERQVHDMWKDRVLRHTDMQPGHLVSFLRQLDDLL
jgi:hypothetical protein